VQQGEYVVWGRGKYAPPKVEGGHRGTSPRNSLLGVLTVERERGDVTCKGQFM